MKKDGFFSSIRKKMKKSPTKKNEINPSLYFDRIKSKKNQMNEDELAVIYDNCLLLLNDYYRTGQYTAMKKMIFHIETIEQERKACQLGVDTYVYQSDIEDYIEHVADKAVKIIELKNYERKIPDEVIEKLEKVKEIFDSFYVLFTDYTGKIERQVEKKRQAKDPILFGVFRSKEASVIVERFYFIGDWVDEFCDLTLDKLVSVMKEKRHRDIQYPINTLTDVSSLKKDLLERENRDSNFRSIAF